ncbi:hypothetical protein GCM10028772_38900 [Nocardioides ultimimeridianus]
MVRLAALARLSPSQPEKSSGAPETVVELAVRGDLHHLAPGQRGSDRGRLTAEERVGLLSAAPPVPHFGLTAVVFRTDVA